MLEQPDHKNITGSAAGVRGHAVGVGTAAKRLLRAVDQLDYLVRHWLMPVPLEKGARSMPHKEIWIPSSGLPNTVQAAIGHGLRAQYAVDRSMPARLAYLLKEFEKRSSNDNESIARDRFASAT